MIEMERDTPLVSICVVSYNSAKTIIETLNSISKQTYKQIELIISDDSSKDDTVTIARKWLAINKNRFINSQIITVENNTGITANCNRAAKCAKGKYIKIIAADDILLSSYCNDCIAFFFKNPSCDVLFTKLETFSDDEIINTELHEEYEFLKATQHEQLERILIKGLPLLPTPTCIYTKRILMELNYFDESIPMWEDGPMYFRLSKNNIKLELLDKTEVLYRISSTSLSNAHSVIHNKSIALFYFKYYFREELKLRPFHAFCHIITNTLWYNSNKRFAKFLLRIVHRNKDII